MPLGNKTIFVFGSNREGRHGKGDALTARKHHGAIYGQAEGLQGDSYAIITKELRKDYKKVTLKEIAEGVKKFLKFAKNNPELTFNVQPVGCGLAGRTPKQIGPMFKKRTKNVLLPKCFTKYCRSLEERFARAWKKKYPRLPPPVPQYKFYEERNFKSDFAWPKEKVLVEIQGGSFSFGGHNRAVVQSADYDKARWAARLGWKFLPFNTLDMGQVDDGKVFDCVNFVAEVLCNAQEIE